MSAVTVLRTKLTPPPMRPDRVQRPRLTQRLAASLDRPLVLISAPAGYGKSTLAAEWYASEIERARPLAWLSLDDDDNDPVRFLTYLISAVAIAGPIQTEDLLALVRSPQPPPPKAILTALIGQIEDIPGRLGLVVDDYHLIAAPSIHDAMIYLLDHLPSRMSLVVTSREDPPFPLAKLRGRGQLTELRADDLRFTPEEVGQFLSQMLGVDLSAGQLADLDARTEGWIAGLQLAGLAMKGRTDLADFISAFTGSHRFVLDYLTEEALKRQPKEIQEFLMHTSILDRFNGPLVDAVLGRTDGQQSLEAIERANLFLIPLDDEGYWYRYHHLFGDTLRRHLKRLYPTQVPDLHRRAAAWFEQNGWVPEALEHALRSQDTEQAARLVEQTVEGITQAGQAQTILRWMTSLPDAVLRAHPRLCVYYAAVLMFTNQIPAAETWLRAAERALHPSVPADESQAILGWVALLRADIARVNGDLAQAVILAHRALSHLPEREALARAVAVLNVAHGYLADGDVGAVAEQRAVAAIEPLRRLGNLFATMISVTNLARLHTMQGQLRQAAATFALAKEMAPAGGRVGELLNGGAYYVGLGRLHYEWNDLEVAQRHLTLGLEMAREGLSVNGDVVTLGHLTLARIQKAQGDAGGGLALLEDFLKSARARGFAAPLIARAMAIRARMWLEQGDLAAAERWAADAGLNKDLEDLPYAREAEHLALAEIWLTQHQTEAALALLERLRARAERQGRQGTAIEILTLCARAWHTQAAPERALTALSQALAFAEPEGYVRIFVDQGQPMASLLRQAQTRGVFPAYIPRLLAAFKSLPAGAVANTPRPLSVDEIEPLSSRELEVLRWMADGASNREIAEALVVSLGTVKKHLGNIFLKLDAHSRTQALAIAKKHRLL